MAEDSELRDLIAEYEVSLESSQHSKVAVLCSKICAELVGLYDNKCLENDNNDSDLDENGSKVEFQRQREIVESVCQKLREYSQLATAYSDVIEFVSVRDMVCLAKLVGALVETNGKEQVKLIDIDELARLLRKSIFLLRTINRSGDTSLEATSAVANLRLGKDNIRLISGTGFPILELGVRKLQSERSQLQSYDGYRTENETSFYPLDSDWFQEFSHELTSSRYPLDRFTILIAIWLIGEQCKHTNLERLVSELVEQVYHEETNSCNEEELMQLTQVGSFWLSYHKRYGVAMKQADIQVADEDNEEDQLDSSGSLGSAPSSIGSLDDDHDVETNHSKQLSAPVDLRAQMRKMIDDELLNGVTCFLCDYQPEELIEPLKSEICPGCGRGSNERCALSFEPLALFNLEALKAVRPKLRTLVVITNNEWIRYLLAPRLEAQRLRYSESLANSRRVVERVDISETFERLTMVRDESSGDDDDDDDKSSEESRNSDQNIIEDAKLSDYKVLLKSFMKVRPDKKEPALSESLRMIRYSSQQCEVLPICASDLLLIDSVGDSVQLVIAASGALGSKGSIWICSARSDVSSLLIGCNRLFSSVELARLGQSSIERYSCPFCDLCLNEIRGVKHHSSSNL